MRVWGRLPHPHTPLSPTRLRYTCTGAQAHALSLLFSLPSVANPRNRTRHFFSRLLVSCFPRVQRHRHGARRTHRQCAFSVSLSLQLSFHFLLSRTCTRARVCVVYFCRRRSGVGKHTRTCAPIREATTPPFSTVSYHRAFPSSLPLRHPPLAHDTSPLPPTPNRNVFEV